MKSPKQIVATTDEAVTPPVANPAADDEGYAITAEVPSWLTSLVCHLTLLVLMALLSTAGHGLGSGIGMSVEMPPGGSQGASLSDDLGMGQSLSKPSDLTSPTALSDPTANADLNASIAEPIDPVPSINLKSLTKPVAQNAAAGADNEAGASDLAGSGAGKGHGRGDGAGDGEGLGDGSGSGISPIRTKVFGLADEGTRFVYVFDRSESMNSTLNYTSEGATVYSVTPLACAKAELLRSLNDLTYHHRFQIVFYNHTPLLFDGGRSPNPQLLVADKKNRARATEFVNSIYGEGGTYHMDALELALKMKPDVIFLLTDGEPKDDPPPYQLERIKQLNKGRAKINVIQFVLGTRADGPLVKMAKENGGKHVYINISSLGPGLPNGPNPLDAEKDMAAKPGDGALP